MISKKTYFCFALMTAAIIFANVITAAASGEPVEKKLFPGRTYNPQIPSPSEFLGYEVGGYHTTYAPMVFYFRELAEKSERIVFGTYGQSYEKRPLYYAVISSENNIRRLNDIKASLSRLANPHQIQDKAQEERILETTPAVVFLIYGDDGNETAAFESALHTAYQLVAATDQKTTQMLEELVVIITPALNPDSHERFVAWYNANQVGPQGTADPNASEHFAPWGMDTNNNHYQINLNRESVWNTQRETQALAHLYLEWNPQVLVDHHGQPVEFIGPWYSEPLNVEITKNQRQWLVRFGEDMAEIFQNHGFRYSPWEFGVLYPGYWDGFSLLNGAIGFTTESGGGGWKGLQLLLPGGHTTRLKDGIIQNMTADQSVLRVTARGRRQKLEDFLSYKRSAVEEAKDHPVQAYVIPASNDPQRTDSVVNLMIRNGIRIFRAKKAFKVSQAAPYFRGKAGPRSFAAGSYVVPMAQPQSRLLRVLMDPHTKIPKDYLDGVRETRKLKQTPGYLNPSIWTSIESFYDVTAWCLPLTFNMEAYQVPQIPRIEMDPLRDEIHTPGQFINPEAAFCYVFDYRSNRAIAAVSRLRQESIKFHVASSAFRIGEHRFGRGAVVVFFQENQEIDLRAAMKEIVQNTGIYLLGVNHNLVDEGPHLGSDQYLQVVTKPVAVVKDGPVRPSSFGSIWFLCEQVYGVPFTALKFGHLPWVDLREYGVLIFPDGFYTGINKATEKTTAKKLRRWVIEGGSLIGIKGASAWLAREEMGLTSIRTLGTYIGKSIYMTDGGHPPLPVPVSEEIPSGEEEAAEPEAASVEQLSVQSQPMVPGAILRAKVYPHHYLSYGYGEDVPVLMWSNLVFSTPQHVGVPVFFAEADQALVAGFAFPDSVDKLAGTPYLMDEVRGQGHVILYADDPNFRLYWDGLTRLFFNSVFFSNSF
ncbi:MAG: M14 family zinc carboxypeptidase [Candidatus Aminicenantes bacterium]